MKRILKISLLLIALVSMAGVAQAQKFGYVNSAAILAEMPKVKQADANLEALQKQLENKGKQMVEKYQQDVMALQQRVERGELSPKQQEEEGQKLQERQNEIAQYRQESLAQLEEKRNNELKPIYDEINAAIEAVAKENGYTFIFEQGVLLYADESLDVSNLVKAKLGM
jgi:outer membrane protein